jgi:hypothetical protein
MVAHWETPEVKAFEKQVLEAENQIVKAISELFRLAIVRTIFDRKTICRIGCK